MITIGERIAKLEQNIADAEKRYDEKLHYLNSQSGMYLDNRKTDVNFVDKKTEMASLKDCMAVLQEKADDIEFNKALLEIAKAKLIF